MPTIYSLVSIDKECTNCKYVNAISYSKELLQNMIQNIDQKLLKHADFVIQIYTDIYSLFQLNGKIMITRQIEENKIFNPDNLYAFNKFTSHCVENVLLDITGFDIDEVRKFNIFKNELSENKILFDTFYDEGIMNA